MNTFRNKQKCYMQEERIKTEENEQKKKKKKEEQKGFR